MAKTTTATKQKTASGKNNAVTTGKKPITKTTTGGLDDLNSLPFSTRDMEAEQRAETGGQNSFITLVTKMSGVLDENSPTYMKGVKLRDYVITSKKVVVSDKRQCIDATIIGMFKLYAETKKKESENEIAPTVSFWMPEDAQQFPILPGSYFDRGLPNGNILQPVHWVFLYLHDHPEIEDALISFRSKGNSIYVQLAKEVIAASSVCTELRFEISSQGLRNEKYKKTDYYPLFTIVGHNYTLTDGGVTKAKDSNVDKATLAEILTRSKKVYEDYKNMKLVAKKNTQALLGGSGRPAISAGYEDDDEDEGVAF